MKLPVQVVMPVQITAILLSGLGLGCVPVSQLHETDEDRKAHYYSQFRQDREALMRARWSGRLYADLVTAMGREGVLMTTPRIRGVGGSAVIFGINDPLSSCVDSFVVTSDDEPVIDNYFCR